jgi:7-keto-8-aminopelargonate synthetase-like enzyme
MAASQRLNAAGFLVPCIRYPTVARGSARLRFTVSASHDMAQIDALKQALQTLPLDGMPQACAL